MKLVVLDDNTLDHLIIGRMLNRCQTGDHIKHSYNGYDLIKTLKTEPLELLPDIIFLDLNMPTMSGWQFLERLKYVEKRRKQIVVYVLSSSINPADINRSKRYSFVKDYIVKPISLEKLKSIFAH